MVHILRSKDNKFYYVTKSDKNGKVLNTSETHSRKEGVVKAIWAQIKTHQGTKLFVIDYSLKNGEEYLIFNDDRERFIRQLTKREFTQLHNLFRQSI